MSAYSMSALFSKTLLSNFLLLIAVLGLIELGSFAFFSTFADRFNFYKPERYALKDKDLERVSRAFDPELGWITSFDTPYGERPRGKDYPKSSISMFGDSYTYGAQVDHQYTIAEYMSASIEANVLNFGVGAYGTDQAYLRFRRDFQKVKTPIVVLGLVSENINRTQNIYRPFYYPPTGAALTKPRFVFQNGVREFLSNPISRVEDIAKLKDPAFIAALGKNDWWFNHKDYPVLDFPFSALLVNKQLWTNAWTDFGSPERNDADPAPTVDTWSEAEPRQLMFSIFDSFVEEARTFGATPVLVFLPRKTELLARLHHRWPTGLSIFNKFCAERNYHCFDAVSALLKYTPDDRTAHSLFFPHLTAKGNKFVAEAFVEYLRTENLVSDLS